MRNEVLIPATIQMKLGNMLSERNYILLTATNVVDIPEITESYILSE